MFDVRNEYPNYYTCMEYYKVAISKTIEENKHLSNDELNNILKEKYPNFKIILDNNNQ